MQFQAAIAAEKMRWSLLAQGVSFTTETVMFDEARWLRFFCRSSLAWLLHEPVLRYDIRPGHQCVSCLRTGTPWGHSVDAEKIVSRYHETHAFPPHALALFDQAWLFDNSLDAELILTKTRDEGLVALVPHEQMPEWATPLAAAHLGRS